MKTKWLCVSALMLLFLVMPVASQDYPGQVNYGPFYLEGKVLRENNEFASGIVYLWHDANGNHIVDFDDWEFETVVLDEDGYYKSQSRYGADLLVILQTHTDGDYVSTYEMTIPTDVIYDSDTVTLPALRVRHRDSDPTIRIINQDGWDMLADNISINANLHLCISFYADRGLAIGQHAYFDLWAQQEILPWSFVVYIDGPTLNVHPREYYDYTIQTPSGIYYYYNLECIDWTADGQGGHYAFWTEWEVLGDANMTFQVYDPMWYLSGTPFYRLPQGPTISINDWNTTVQGAVEWIYEPSPIGNCVGGAIFYAGGEPGAVVPGDDFVDDILKRYPYILITQYPYPIPVLFITTFFLRSRSGRRLLGLRGRPRRKHKQPPRLIPEPYTLDADLVKSGFKVSEAVGPPSAGLSYPMEPISGPTEALDVVPVELVEDLTPVDAVIARDNGTPTWVPECGECGDPLDDPEMIKHNSKLGAYWKCPSCGALNVIRGDD